MPCFDAAWQWQESPGVSSWFVNCVPMTGEGRNIFDVNGPTAETTEFKYMCPIAVTADDDGNPTVLASRPDHHTAFRECVVDDPRCLSTRSLNQLESSKLEGGCTFVSSDSSRLLWSKYEVPF